MEFESILMSYPINVASIFALKNTQNGLDGIMRLKSIPKNFHQNLNNSASWSCKR